MKKILAVLLIAFAAPAYADVSFMVGKDGPAPNNEAEAAAEEEIKHLYAYGGYNFNFADDTAGVKAEKSTGGFTAGLGFRFTEDVRAELAYDEQSGKYETSANFDAKGRFGFLNFIFDAKLPAAYRLFKTNPFVPFVGFGAGAGNLKLKDGAELRNDITFAYNLIGGVSVEINRTLALQFTYRYVRIAPNELTFAGDVIKDFAPSSHNASIAFRMNF